MRFINRQDAGRQLAAALRPFRGHDTVVLALPRGGVVLGAEVARELEAPLGLVLVRKLGHPANSEYAIGAVAEDEAPLYDPAALPDPADETWFKSEVAAARQTIDNRRELYYGEDYSPPDIQNKTVILVDDGIATGFTMEAAALATKNKRPKQVIVAVPIAPKDSVDKIEDEDLADQVVLLDDPENFLGSVGVHYQEFDQVDDEEVQALLWEANDHVYQTTS